MLKKYNMEIIYLPHAVERMAQRKISINEIEEIVTQADGVIEQSKDKGIYFKKIKSRTDNLIAVVAAKDKQRYEIITVMVNFEVKK